MAPAPSIRLLIVDDHPVVRSGLRIVSVLDPAIEVVGESASAGAALADIRRLSPDVVLLDLRLPDGSGVEVCRQAKREQPSLRIVCLTSFADSALVLAAVSAGADAYLLKHSDAERIVEAIHAVRRDEQVFDSALLESACLSTNPSAAADRLSPGERRVLGQVVRGLTDKETAQALNLSVKTVRNCLDRAFVKLGVHNRTQAVMAFLRSNAAQPGAGDN